MCRWPGNIRAIKNLLEISYFNFIEGTIKQAVGVPMGGAASEILANFTLHRLESKAINIAIRQKKYFTLHALKYSYRYLDEIVVINNGEKFESIFKHIYPASLILNKTNSTNQHSDFLDIDIRVCNGKYELEVFDKTKSFK